MSEKIYYGMTTDEVAKDLDTSTEQGLSPEEVQQRLEKYGHNKLREKKRTPIWKIFLSQFKDTLVLVLILAAIVTAVIAIVDKTNNFTDSFIILAILIVNAVIGTIQEHKAMVSLDSLNRMSAPHSKVIRGGNITEISSEEIVPGDVVVLDVGDIVPADIRLTDCVNLKIQEAALTGESVSSDKSADPLQADPDLPIGDRTNIAFSTGLVTYGRGKGIVMATGMATEVGHIAEMLSETEQQEMPLQKRLNQLGKVLGFLALGICVLIFILGILYGQHILDMLLMAVSLGVAAIPEGLQVVATLVLAMGVQRLVKHNAIVRTLPSVETLGSTSIICSDKTGTLTQNKMTITHAWLPGEELIEMDEATKVPEATEESLRLLLEVGSLANEAHQSDDPDAESPYSGDPTEIAFLELASRRDGMSKNDLEAKHPRRAEVPFDSERKMMSTINAMEGKELRTNVKGGTDEVLSRCSHYLRAGERVPLTDEVAEEIRSSNVHMAEEALRVLAVAYADIDSLPAEESSEAVERDLTFVGLVGMIDPARPEVIPAVAECRTAGIKPVMITGDHQVTASAIARQIGILEEGDRVTNGTELEKMSDEELYDLVPHCAVYARVAPEHKVRIVKAWQKHGKVVAMTGDGVNDAPALKRADIGIAMGITGTEVSKDAADVVLTDDNFATIVNSVREGRRIYDNIVKSVQFLLTSNIGEVMLILIATVFNLGNPLLPIHLLWVNLVTDSLPALAISLDPPAEGIMKRPPIDSEKGFFTRGFIWRMCYQGLIIGLLSLTGYLIGKNNGGVELGQTMAFIVICMAQMLNIRNLHSSTLPSWRTSPFRNMPLFWALVVSTLMMAAVVFIPGINDVFHLEMPDPKHFLMVLGLMFVPIVIVNLFKLLGINTIKGE